MKKHLYILLFLISLSVPVIAGTIDSYTEKNPPESGDLFVIRDVDDGSTKKVNVKNIGDGINWSAVGIGTTLPQRICIKTDGTTGYYDGTWSGSCN